MGEIFIKVPEKRPISKDSSRNPVDFLSFLCVLYDLALPTYEILPFFSAYSAVVLFHNRTAEDEEVAEGEISVIDAAERAELSSLIFLA